MTRKPLCFTAMQWIVFVDTIASNSMTEQKPDALKLFSGLFVAGFLPQIPRQTIFVRLGK
jgi:hypothetical protein